MTVGTSIFSVAIAAILASCSSVLEPKCNMSHAVYLDKDNQKMENPKDAAAYEYKNQGFSLMVVMNQNGVYTIPGNDNDVAKEASVMDSIELDQVRFIINDKKFKEYLQKEGIKKAFTTAFDPECYNQDSERFAREFNIEMFKMKSLSMSKRVSH